MLRRYQLSAASVLAALLASGTAGGDELMIGTQVEPTSIDPHYHNTQPNVQIGRQVFDHLIKRDHKQRLRPGLAVSWKALNDTTWEFKLRKGVRWHDGAPFSADDVVFTIARVEAGVPNSPSSFATFTSGKTVVRVDDYTLRVTTKNPYPLMPNDLATFAIVSKKHGEGATTKDYNSGKATVGTGPYTFKEWRSADHVVLEGNKEYWGGKPKWDKVVYKPIKAGPSRIAALLTGDVDMIDKVPTTDIAALRKNPKVAVSQVSSNRVIFFSPDSNRHISPHVKNNDGTPAFPNPLRKWEVRKAISMAINRQAIVDRVMEGAAIPASQLLPGGFFGFNPDLKVEPYDPEGAKKLLAKVGYPDGFRLTVHSPNDRYVNDAKVTEAIAQMLTRVGIKCEVRTLSKSVYFSRGTKLEYSFGMFSNGSDTGESSAPLRSIVHTRTESFGRSNRARYSNVIFDAKLEEALVTVDDAKREQLLQEAMGVVINDYGQIPTHYQVNTWALRKGLTYLGRTDENTLANGVSKVK
jgi:peptide/nickel transport system substrate-binding protein